MQTTTVHMISKQSGYEGNGLGRREAVALDQAEVYDNEEKCNTQAYTRVSILRMTGKKTFHSTDQNPKLEE